jgi:hypothetical protein
MARKRGSMQVRGAKTHARENSPSNTVPVSIQKKLVPSFPQDVKGQAE